MLISALKMLEWNKKSSPMTNGIKDMFKYGNCGSLSSPPTPLSLEEFMGPC
jgi:hypothetical protein